MDITSYAIGRSAGRKLKKKDFIDLSKKTAMGYFNLGLKAGNDLSSREDDMFRMDAGDRTSVHGYKSDLYGALTAARLSEIESAANDKNRVGLLHLLIGAKKKPGELQLFSEHTDSVNLPGRRLVRDSMKFAESMKKVGPVLTPIFDESVLKSHIRVQRIKKGDFLKTARDLILGNRISPAYLKRLGSEPMKRTSTLDTIFMPSKIRLKPPKINVKSSELEKAALQRFKMDKDLILARRARKRGGALPDMKSDESIWSDLFNQARRALL